MPEPDPEARVIAEIVAWLRGLTPSRNGDWSCWISPDWAADAIQRGEWRTSEPDDAR